MYLHLTRSQDAVLVVLDRDETLVKLPDRHGGSVRWSTPEINLNMTWIEQIELGAVGCQ